MGEWADMKTHTIILFLLFILVNVLFVFPIVYLFVGSLSSSALTVLPPFSFKNYLDAFSDPLFTPIVVNTLAFSVGAALLSLVLGMILAWKYSRTIFRGRGLIGKLSYLGITVPVFVQALGWIFLLNGNNGLINELAKFVLRINHPLFDVYSLPGMILVQGLVEVPLSFAILSSAISQFDRELESAARISGASTYATVTKVVLPLLLPSMVACFLLTFAGSIESFAVPLFVGQGAGITVLSTKVYFAIAAGLSPQFGEAAAYGIILCIPVVILTYVGTRLTTSEKYQFVRGSSSTYVEQRKGGITGLISTILTMTVVVMIVFLPLSVLLYTSIIQYFHPPDAGTLGLITFKGYQDVLFGSLSTPLINTLIYGTIAASIGLPVAFMLAYATHTYTGRLSDYFRIAAGSISYSTPGIVFGLALLWTYIRTPIYGTMWMLILAYICKFLPLGFRTLVGGVSRMHKEMEEAAILSGASILKRTRRIFAPLLKSDFATSWILICAGASRDISMTLLLYSTNTITVSVDVYNLYNSVGTNEMASLAIFLAFILLTMFSIIRRVFKT